MGKKDLKTRVQYTSTLKKELYEAIQAMSIETQVPISRLIDTAIKGFLQINKKI